METLPGRSGVSKPFWRDRAVFVTGATGLLGSNLVKRLVALEAEVVCLVRDWIPNSELVLSGMLERVRMVRGDICDQALLERTLADYGVATVFHLAAQTLVGVANQHPTSTFDTNIRGTWVLLEACRLNPRVEQIVIASSDKAYGDQDVLPYAETTPLQGKHPYDVSKSCADLIAQSYAYSYGLPVCITRCGNFFGEGDLNWSRIIPGTIRSIVRGEAPIIRSNGQYIRDYLYVQDGVAAYLLTAEQMAEQPHLRGQAFNFSNEVRLTVLELVQRVQQIMQSDIAPQILNQASNEILYQYLDSSKARQQLGWQPLYSLDEALGHTVNWYREFLGGA